MPRNRKILELAREIEFGQIVITIKRGVPVHVDEVRKAINLPMGHGLPKGIIKYCVGQWCVNGALLRMEVTVNDKPVRVRRSLISTVCGIQPRVRSVSH